MESFFKNKFFVGLAVVALFLLGLMLYAFTNDSATLPGDIAGTVVSPAQKGGAGFFGFGTNIIERITNYGKVKAENEQLKQKIAALESDLAKNEVYKTENAQLKSLLGIKEASPDFVFESAEVVAKDPGDWFAVFTIDKGSLNGIKKGCPVVTSDGLAGRVKEVGLSWAKVVAIIDTDCVVGSIVARTRDAAVVQGDLELSRKGLCKMTYIDNAVNINRGDIIDTSGLGGIFPKGLRIGRIEEIRPEPHGISQYAVIRPAVDFNKLKNVYVIKSFNGSEDSSLGGQANAKP